MGRESCTIRMAGSNRSTHPSPCLASGLMPAHMPARASSQQSSPWCPNRIYLQVSGEGDQVERGTSRLLHEDSYHWRQFPTFHLKNRRTFTLFTSKGTIYSKGTVYTCIICSGATLFLPFLYTTFGMPSFFSLLTCLLRGFHRGRKV